MSKSKAYIEKNDIVDRLKEVIELAKLGHINYMEEENEQKEIELIIKVKEGELNGSNSSRTI